MPLFHVVPFEFTFPVIWRPVEGVFSVEISKMNNAHNLNILYVSRTRSKLDLLCEIILLYGSFFSRRSFHSISFSLFSFISVERCQLAFVLCASVYTVKIIEHAQTKRLSDSMWPNSFNAFDYCCVLFLFLLFCLLKKKFFLLVFAHTMSWTACRLPENFFPLNFSG